MFSNYRGLEITNIKDETITLSVFGTLVFKDFFFSRESFQPSFVRKNRWQMTNCKKTVVYVGLQSLIKPGVGLKPICKIIENSAELPPMRNLVFSDQSADKKSFFLTKIVLLQILILNCSLSGRTMRIAG